MNAPRLTLADLSRDLTTYTRALAALDGALDALAGDLPGIAETRERLTDLRGRLHATRVAYAGQPVLLGDVLTANER